VSKAFEKLWYPPEGEDFATRVAFSPLSVAAWAFRAGVAARNALYDRGALNVTRVEEARVVSVGNLNVGGSGKTPAVIFLANFAAARGLKVAVLSRGYGRRARHDVIFDQKRALSISADECGDEPLLVARRCPQALVLVGRDRAALASKAAGELGAQLLLLDDGMQHRRLARDIELVVVDQAAGFGNGQMLPRGPLREPLSSLSRASLIWLRTSEQASPPLPDFGSVPVVRARYRAALLVDPSGVTHPPGALRNRKVIALAGLARPTSFLATLDELGMNVVERRLFGDHHRFRESDLALPGELPVVTTEKDAARLPRGFPAWTVQLEVELLEGEQTLEKMLCAPR
jgi:tetraacyldisaccharide 4'-kinase